MKHARKATLEAFFREHNVRYPGVIETRVHAIKTATARTDDSAVILPHQLLVQALVEQLRVTREAIERFDTQIETVSQSLPDYALFRALPGAGPTFASRLLAAFGEQRDRYPNAAAVQNYSGLAPVTERSGKKHWVHWRLQCPKFLRQTFVEWAAETIPRSFWAGAYYRRQRGFGRFASSRLARLGVQVDPDSLSLLADQDTLRRVHLPECVEAPRLTTTQFNRARNLKGLTVHLRAWVRAHF